jgi:hypothetical protein
MKAGVTVSVVICLISAAVLVKMVSSTDDVPSGQRTVDGDRATPSLPSHPAPVADQRSLGGVVAAWSGSPAQTKEALAAQERAEALAAHEREVAIVSIRMLQIQARQDPARAEFYLKQINDKATVPRDTVPPAPYRQAAERQRQVNDTMSEKLDRLRAAQRR